MKKKDFICIIILAAALAAAAYLTYFKEQPSVSDYKECVEAGYPVTEGWPSRCRTPDGRTYTEELPALEAETICREDADCMLVNRDLGFSCCWAGACDVVDYSLDRWIAVNRTWFEEVREDACPRKDECGPTPLCPTRIINVGYTANCSRNECVKYSIACIDSCGDGTCQDETWENGNACVETNETCPADCGEKAGEKVAEVDKESGNEPDVVDKRTSRIDYSCESNIDCSIKDVGSLCGEYLQCVNINFEPEPPEIESNICGFPEIDGCRCVNERCLGEYGGELSVN